MKKSQKISHKIVVKVGSSLLTGGGTTIVAENLHRIVGHIVRFVKEDKSVIVVTSGAVASGLSILGFSKRPADLAELQAAAAVGQNILMQAYNVELEKYALKGAQVLLTNEDFGDRQRYLNASNTINTLLRHKIVPIINENDAISVDEIKFGDNDTLSARVAAAVKADGLLILTDIDGLYKTYDTKTRSGKDLICRVDVISPEIKKSACGTDKASCVGGMSTKIQAALIGTSSGVPVVLANGLKEELNINFNPLPGQEGDGTCFVVNFSGQKKPGLKKHWIAFEAKTKGRIVVDDGARTALAQNYKSLLAPGVVGVEGNFKAGDIIEIADKAEKIFAKGKVNFSSVQLQEIKGKKNKDEVVHRDNLVVIG